MNTRCKDCDHVCAEPSFSEGPKTTNPDTGIVERFMQCLNKCPKCLSTNLEPAG